MTLRARRSQVSHLRSGDKDQTEAAVKPGSGGGRDADSVSLDPALAYGTRWTTGNRNCSSKTAHRLHRVASALLGCVLGPVGYWERSVHVAVSVVCVGMGKEVRDDDEVLVRWKCICVYGYIG